MESVFLILLAAFVLAYARNLRRRQQEREDRYILRSAALRFDGPPQ
jgi:hypothetical protein